MSVVLGLDVSTTATKAVVVDADGRVRAAASSEYGFDAPRPLWSEQDPRRWWEGTIHAVRSVLAESGMGAGDVAGVGLAGQMHGLVALDRRGEPLRPAILWNDQRTGAECDAIREAVGAERLIEITGNDALPGFTAPKLLWVRRHEPDVWRRIAHVVLPKDFVRLRLTGDLAVDRADGSGTILFDLAARDWSSEVLEALEVDRGWLPPAYEGTEVTGVISEAAASLTGLRAGTPVVAGGGDQAAAAVGVGAVEPGILSVSLGTSGVVFAATDRPRVEPRGRLHAFCHAVPERWHLMGVMLSAAGSLRWFRDALAPETGFAELTAEAATVPAGADGVTFLPYLSGERTPHVDPLARGAFVGLTLAHTRAHLTRAVLEGVAYGLRDSLELIRGMGLTGSTRIRVTGGGGASPLWRQILADVMGATVVTTWGGEGAAQGAATLAAVGIGWFGSVADACATTVREHESAHPSDAGGVYVDGYERFRALYPALGGRAELAPGAVS